MEIHTHNIYYPLPDQYFIMKNLLIKNMVKKNHQRQTSIKKITNCTLYLFSFPAIENVPPDHGKGFHLKMLAVLGLVRM